MTPSQPPDGGDKDEAKDSPPSGARGSDASAIPASSNIDPEEEAERGLSLRTDPSARNQVSLGGEHTQGQSGKQNNSGVEEPRGRERWAWLWPVVILGLMVAVGTLAGSLGAFLTCVVAVCTILLFIGDRALKVVPKLAVITIGALLFVGALIGNQLRVPFFTNAPFFSDGLAATTTGKGFVVVHVSGPNLRGKRVTAKDIEGKNLRFADLSGANLEGLDLHGMDLTGVKAAGASFQRAILDRARLQDADLRGADLRDACLYGVDLTRAKMQGLDATGSDVTDAIVSEASTRQARWPVEGSDTSSLMCGR